MSAKPFRDSIDKFFSRFPKFQYDRNKSSSDQFHRLCRVYGWKKGQDGTFPPEREAALREYRIATTRAFNRHFGKDKEDNDAWGRLCSQLGVDPIPNKIEDRRKVR